MRVFNADNIIVAFFGVGERLGIIFIVALRQNAI